MTRDEAEYLSRKITNDDLWAAIRGLSMYRMTKPELAALWREHKDKTMFASRVIAEAALHVSATKPMED